MLAIAWRCLTGRYVASDFADRERAEWPPHPDRFFQAFVAAWGERGEDEMERQALEWLESLNPPSIVAAEPEDCPTPVKTYVPTNDIEASERERKSGNYGKKLTGILPAYRPRMERFFPYVRVGDSTFAFVWEDAAAGQHRAALERLAGAVSRIGHSSSLVHCWVEDGQMAVDYMPEAIDRAGTFRLRVPERGRLSTLVANHLQAKQSHAYLPPPAARQIGYRRTANSVETFPNCGFSDRLIIFAQKGGNRFSYLQTYELAAAFRAFLIKSAQATDPSILPLVSGHAPNGEPLDKTHIAYIPLGFAGAPYADGHLLGMALALPDRLSADEEEAVYKVLARAVDDDGGFPLLLGAKGVMHVGINEGTKGPKALDPRTWIGPARIWSSITPVVIDRMAKAKDKDLQSWAISEIALACERRSLPRPERIDASPVPFVPGSFPCYRHEHSRAGGSVGPMFPPIIRKDGQANWMFHAHIEFSMAIQGPLLLGAGRYRGYGLFKPEPASWGNHVDNRPLQ